MSKTQDAMALVDQGMAPYAAARQVEMSPNTLYVALKRRREKETQEACPCCGSLVAKDKIDWSVVK